MGLLRPTPPKVTPAKLVQDRSATIPGSPFCVPCRPPFLVLRYDSATPRVWKLDPHLNLVNRGWVRLVSSEGWSGSERVLALCGAGVAPLVLGGEVEAPVFIEVAVADYCAQGEDGFGAVQPPACSGDVEPFQQSLAWATGRQPS